MCSISILLTIEKILLNFKKLPSDSSASTTDHSPFPSMALDLMEFIIPPLTIVGKNLLSLSKCETKDVIVVFP